MLRNAAKVGAAAAVLAAAIFLPASPVSSQDAGPTMGYTLIVEVDEGRNCRLATIDLDTAQVTALPAAASRTACVSDLAVAPDGTVWGISQSRRFDILGDGFTPQAESPLSLVALDPTTGAVTGSVTIDIPGDDGDAFLAEGGLAITPDGTVWVLFAAEACDFGNQNCLWTIDPSTGSATLVGETGTFEQEMFGLAACSAGVVTLVPGGTNGPESVPAFYPNPDVGFLDPATGQLTYGPGISDTVVGYDCSGSAGWALTGESFSNGIRSVPQAVDATLTSFDPATGTLTEIAAVSPATTDVVLLAVPPTSAPAPTTTTTTTTTTSTTSAVAPATTAAAQPAVVTPRFTG